MYIACLPTAVNVPILDRAASRPKWKSTRAAAAGRRPALGSGRGDGSRSAPIFPALLLPACVSRECHGPHPQPTREQSDHTGGPYTPLSSLVLLSSRSVGKAETRPRGAAPKPSTSNYLRARVHRRNPAFSRAARRRTFCESREGHQGAIESRAERALPCVSSWPTARLPADNAHSSCRDSVSVCPPSPGRPHRPPVPLVRPPVPHKKSDSDGRFPATFSRRSSGAENRDKPLVTHCKSGYQVSSGYCDGQAFDAALGALCTGRLHAVIGADPDKGF